MRTFYPRETSLGHAVLQVDRCIAMFREIDCTLSGDLRVGDYTRGNRDVWDPEIRRVRRNAYFVDSVDSRGRERAGHFRG